MFKVLRIILIFILMFPNGCKSNDQARIIKLIKNFENKLKAKIGISAIDLNTNKQFEYNGYIKFPMASTRKIAIAAKFLQMEEQGVHRISELLPVDVMGAHKSGTLMKILFNNK